MLFIFRLKRRAIYGVVEAITGLVVASYRVYSDYPFDLKDPGFYLALLTAGIFLIVRGFDNIHQGLVNNPKGTLAIKMHNRYFLKKESKGENGET
ncbi:MAG: hypothetical protein JNJ47_07790 [Alphaproteobacteria bacterium]|nr:hypothetical protein [Alphaproteobacteria bacterium]